MIFKVRNEPFLVSFLKNEVGNEPFLVSFSFLETRNEPIPIPLFPLIMMLKAVILKV